MPNNKLRAVLLISGGGSTAEAIIKATQSGRLANVTVSCVIASTHESKGIAKAKALGIPTHVVRRKQFATPDEYGVYLLQIMRNVGTDYFGQHGWLIKTPEIVINRFPNMSVNQHPGPVRIGSMDFGGVGMFGLRVHHARNHHLRCLGNKEGRMWTEATAQRVAVEYDKGLVLKVARVPVLQTDHAEDIAARMLPLEHELHIETLDEISRGCLVPVTNLEPAVLPSEHAIWQTARDLGIQTYPNG